MAAKDFARMARMKVIASVQPYHAIDDGRWAEKRIGPQRAKTTYPFRAFLENNVPICFGSDWFVAPLSPLWGIYAAVTRATLDGKRPGGWVPEQKISVAQAIHAYTMGNAYAAFEENLKGSLAPGKLADLTVLSANLFEVAPEKIKDVAVEMTILGGRVVYQKN
jgi:predicted amidohydrolase YtcJ